MPYRAILIHRLFVPQFPLWCLLGYHQWWPAIVSTPAAKTLLTKLSVDPTTLSQYSLKSGVLRYRNRIWVGADKNLQQRLIAEFHSSAWGGHSGVPVTYMRLKQCFAWTRMKAAVRAFVQSCTVCQQSKYDRSKSPGLLQPLLVPDSAWQVISLDFIEVCHCPILTIVCWS
jgi:hypothetical protein